MFHVCHAHLAVPCSLVVTYLDRADLLALLYVMFSCIFVTIPYGVLDPLWYYIASIPDLCLLPYLLGIFDFLAILAIFSNIEKRIFS